MEAREFEEAYRYFRKLYPSKKKDLCFEACKVILNNRAEFKLDHLSDADLIGALCGLFLKGDKKISKDETEFIYSCFREGKYYDAVVKAVRDNDYADIDAWDEIIDSLSKDTKDAVTMLGMCIIAVDREITPEERALFEKIYN